MSKFTSPVYGVKKYHVKEIVGQSTNPNSMTSKSFAALTQSIFNSGYAQPITCQMNPVYDESKDTLTDLEKLKMVIKGGENDETSAGDAYATQISDEEIRKMYRVQIVDGMQRSSVVRLGTKLFLEDANRDEKAAKWDKALIINEDGSFDQSSEEIPQSTQGVGLNEMLKYIAWREDFSLPCAILYGKSEMELMSSTVLFNSARGSHSLDSMREIVNNLINVAGMSKEWVSQNLYLDIESIDRMQQLSGLKASFADIDDAELAWNPEADRSYQRKMTAYLIREATSFINKYKADNSGWNEPTMGTAIDIALEIGFDQDPMWLEHGEQYLELLKSQSDDALKEE